ncbi:MAG: GNAT family N-acetyltransferase [Planctomycetes bacterium]|nr:GNAT family N-acetyltransferase [Planctomycetota bacterium]
MQRSSVSSILRSNQAYCDLLCDKQTLTWGIAFHSRAWSALPQANQFREVVISDDQQIPEAYDAAEAFFADEGLTCRRWAPAEGQPDDALGRYLEGLGYQRRETTTLALGAWPDVTKPRSDFRILPARPMRAAYRATFDSGTDNAAIEADAAVERLDDGRLEAIVVMDGDQPIGRATLFEVGDIGRLVDVYVVPEARGRGAAKAMVAHLLAVARRLAVGIVCVQVDSADEAAMAFFQGRGFVCDGTICEFDAPEP